jgi:hypothetical protein
MGYQIYSLKGGHHREESEADEFFEAAEKARRAVEKMHDLASEMEHRYGERYYGMRGDRYGMRDHEMWDDDMYGERRRRDSRGRYM